MKAQFHQLATLFYGIGVLTACAGQPQRGSTPAPKGSLDVISEADIDASHGRSAYEVIDRKRPMYLMSKLDLAPNAERAVYLNGIRLGGIAELRLIPASEVKEIRFVRAIDGSAYETGRSGAILVISKSGR